MPNGVSLPANLLQSLKDDPALNGIEPRLSALRLSRTVPVLRPPKSQVCPLKVVPRRAFRAIPALSARVRYSKSINLSSKPALIASLDIEIPSFIQYTVEIKSIKLRLPNGEAEDVTSRNGLKLPIKCRSRDNVIFLYRLLAGVSLTDGVIAASNAKMLEISISAAVLVSDNCLPRIEMRWSTGVDFSTALNPNFGAPGQSMQRGNRPTSLPSVNPLNSNALLATRDEKRALDSEVAPEQAMSSLSDLGLTVTITDIGKVYVGEPFRWEVLIVNRSTRPQKLAIVVTPKRKKEDIKRHVSRHSGSLSHDGKKDTVSGAIVDENYLHAMQKMDALEDAYLVCLTTDIRIGPLNPGSCYSTELKFLPLAKGYLQVDSVRIIDISSTETVEVRDLPDIIAIERPRED
ncbi:hypothetical protein MMC06_003879 [Schaereria dolodes]|nr:hypothetical protein [Schaereria dolodes]